VHFSSRPARAIAFAAAAAALAAPAVAQRSAASVSIEGMSYALSRGGANELIVEAERAEVAAAGGGVALHAVHARLGSFAGASRDLGGLELRCATGTLEAGSGQFRAEGQITGRTGDGREFRTERLEYRHDRGLVSTDAPVWIRDAAGTYRGGGFRYWVRENRFRLTGGASIVGRP
jgi:hypothetical protein